jgi:hypothetical protein
LTHIFEFVETIPAQASWRIASSSVTVARNFDGHGRNLEFCRLSASVRNWIDGRNVQTFTVRISPAAPCR